MRQRLQDKEKVPLLQTRSVLFLGLSAAQSPLASRKLYIVAEIPGPETIVRTGCPVWQRTLCDSSSQDPSPSVSERIFNPFLLRGGRHGRSNPPFSDVNTRAIFPELPHPGGRHPGANKSYIRTEQGRRVTDRIDDRVYRRRIVDILSDVSARCRADALRPCRVPSLRDRQMDRRTTGGGSKYLPGPGGREETTEQSAAMERKHNEVHEAMKIIHNKMPVCYVQYYAVRER
mmetsp:Transcript_1990/g.4240  ORF Transcript_1990/g.4240 Transcript_1990/m.4240 type:complete len:231 (-) Transcript_1990:780-1472(-)